MLKIDLTAAFGGMAADRYVTARVLAFGAICAALGFFLRGSVMNPEVFVFSGVIVRIGTGACSFPVVIAALSKVVTAKQCSFVMGLGTASASLGTRIARNRSRKFDFETTRGGGRYSASVGSALTGREGDIIIIDDAHKPDETHSEVRRNSVLEWYGSTLLSRCNDPGTKPIIVFQQRIHENDLAGMILEQGGWEHLKLQAIAEYLETFDLGSRGFIHRKEGDLLHEERLPRDLLNDYNTQLGSYVYAAQYQQRPAPIDGGIVKWDWFKTYDAPPKQEYGDEIVQCWETASSAGELNDYSVCTTWLVRKPQAWMLDLWRGRLEYPERQRKIKSLAVQANANRVLMEQAGSGISLIQDLSKSSDLNVIGIIPKQDKASRLMSVSAMIEAGRILIPKEASWLADFRRKLTMFPNARNDDQVDSLSQFLNRLDQLEFKWYVGGSHY